MELKNYVRKPFSIDAVQVTTENINEVAKWCKGVVIEERRNGVVKEYIKVDVHHPMNESQTRAFIDDYVCYASQGFKVYGPKAFERNFELPTVEATEDTTPKTSD